MTVTCWNRDSGEVRVECSLDTVIDDVIYSQMLCLIPSESKSHQWQWSQSVVTEPTSGDNFGAGLQVLLCSIRTRVFRSDGRTQTQVSRANYLATITEYIPGNSLLITMFEVKQDSMVQSKATMFLYRFLVHTDHVLMRINMECDSLFEPFGTACYIPCFWCFAPCMFLASKCVNTPQSMVPDLKLRLERRQMYQIPRNAAQPESAPKPEYAVNAPPTYMQ